MVIERWRGDEVVLDLFLCARVRLFVLLLRNRFVFDSNRLDPDDKRCGCLEALREEGLCNPLEFLAASRISGSRVATLFEGLLTPPWDGMLGGIVLCFNKSRVVSRTNKIPRKLKTKVYKKYEFIGVRYNDVCGNVNLLCEEKISDVYM